MVDQEVFFTRLAERQRARSSAIASSVRGSKAGDDLAKQTVVLGAGTTVSLDDIDWETSASRNGSSIVPLTRGHDPTLPDWAQSAAIVKEQTWRAANPAQAAGGTEAA